jgi:O-antigen/teichoic acid export membrane protein
VFAPEVITVLYSAKYLPGTGVFMAYSLVLLIRCTYWGMMLNATGKTQYIFRSAVGSLVLNAILNLICYPIFGFVGPAVATLLSMVAISLLQIAYTGKIMEIPVAQIFPWKACGSYLLLNGVIGAACYFAKTLLSERVGIHPVLAAIAMGILWLALYGAIILRTLKKHWEFLNKGD